MIISPPFKLIIGGLERENKKNPTPSIEKS